MKTPKGKQAVDNITTPMAAAEVEETIHEDETEDQTGYNLRRVPRQEKPVQL